MPTDRPAFVEKGQFVPVPNVAVLVRCRSEAQRDGEADDQPFTFCPRRRDLPAAPLSKG